MTTLSAVTSAIGSAQQGAGAAQAGAYNAAVARSNAAADQQAALLEAQQLDYAAQVAEQDAKLAEMATAFRVQQQTRLRAMQRGEQEAQLARSGVLLEGSPLEVLLTHVHESAREANLLTYQGELEALARRREAQLGRYQADVRRVTGRRSLLVGEQQARLKEFEGEQAKDAASIQALGALYRGAGLAYGSYVRATGKAPSVPYDYGF